MNRNQARENHYRGFSMLRPEEQIEMALSFGHSLRNLMSAKARAFADRLRNGAKKISRRSR